MFATEYYVTTDILVLGKSLGDGIMPFAGIVTRSKLTQSIGHYTHERNGLCGVAALSMIVE